MIYDTETNIISWEIAKGPIMNTVEFGNFIIHVSGAGKPILIEILNASKFIGQFGKLKLANIEEIKQILPVN